MGNGKRDKFKAEVKERDNYECQGKWSEDCTPLENLTVHHVIPQTYGGTHDVENGVTLCQGCHTFIELRISRMKQAVNKRARDLMADLAQSIYENMKEC